MKKIICLIIAAVLCLSVFTSCEQIQGFLADLTVSPEENAALDAALEYVSTMYKDLAGTHAKDFEVVGQAVIGGVKYPITWTADSDKVSIRESVKFGYYTIDIPSNAESDLEFTLTATISSTSSIGTRVKDFAIKVLSAESAKQLSIPDAIDLGEGQGNSKYTEDKYYVSGTVGEFYGDGGTTFGNFYIADDEGNQILIYGTYDVNGSRYDTMSNKPVKGDKITVYGIVGNYNGTPQLKDVTVTSINGIEQTPSADKAILSFADKANRVSQDTGSQVWSSNGITFTNNKASSTTNVADYSNPVRCYKNSSITLEYNGMKTVKFVCDNKYEDCATPLCTALKNAGYSATVSGAVVTVVFSEAANSMTANLTEGQVRISSIEISAN